MIDKEKIFMKKIILATFCLHFFCSMLFAGGPVKSDSEIIYKEVIEDGKTITRQFKFLHYYEYNSDGKKIYEKRSKDNPEREVWYTYDEKGRLISTSSGVTYTYDENGYNTRYSLSKNNFITYEYDLNGNKIHEKRSRDGVEQWYEYDKAGNQILHKISNGMEIFSEYDSKGNKISEKWISDGKTLGRQYIYKYNSKNYLINLKEIKYKNDGTIDTTMETVYEYDRNGYLTIKEEQNTNEYGTGVTTHKYEYDKVGNEISEFRTQIWKNEVRTTIHLHELEYWDSSKTKLKSDSLWQYYGKVTK